jgi:alpha-galactosidase
MQRRTFFKWTGSALAGSLVRVPEICGKETSAGRLTDLLPSPSPGKFAQALAPGLGLSVSYSGLTGAQVISRLEPVAHENDKSEDGHEIRRVKVEDRETDLRLTVEYTLYPEHHAIVYGGTLENAGLRNVAQLTNLLSYDLVFKPLQNFGDPLLHTSKGGGAFDYYPPDAWTLEQRRLFGPGKFTLDSGPSGRSSNDECPFFIVEDAAGASGIFGGIEWSGLWRLEFIREDEPALEQYGAWGPDKSFAIRGGIKGVDLTLETGERFHIPRVLLGFYEGSIDEGRNALRHFLSDWAPPFPKGAPAPHVQATPGGVFTSQAATIDKNVRLNAKACAEIGVEYYCVEQWYPWYPYASDDPETTRMSGWARGSWVPDVRRFPDLKELADYVRSLGMQFGLWTDIEVASAGSAVARQHPEWVLFLPGKQDGLLNFGLRQVQQWAVATYDRLVQDYGIKWIFWDNNIDHGPYWEANEVAGRRGWLQHDHILGVWAVREALLQKHPDVLIENCSSGGRRIDLGMFKRSHFHVLSDQFWYPDAIRYQFSGADWCFPAAKIKSIIDAPLSPLRDDLFHSNFGGLLSITEGVESWTPEEKQRAKHHIEAYKSIRHLLSKDFYPLFPQPQTLKEWDGWQFHDPTSGEGFILVFRAESATEDASVRLQRTNPAAQYVLRDPYSGKEEVVTGRRLADGGLSFRLPAKGTALRTYHPR